MNKYTLGGIAFGFLFPVFATALRYSPQLSLWETHKNDPLLLIIDTAPFFLGLFSYFIGYKQIQIEKHQAEVIAAQALTIEESYQHLIQAAKMAALGEMAGGIAHEINNPLAIVKSLADQMHELIEDETIDRIKFKEMSAKIGRASARIAKIIQGLRHLSRDDSGDAFALLSVRQMIDDTLSFCEAQFKHTGVELTVTENTNDLSVEMRPTQISQVLLNLLNNSRDAVQTLDRKWIKIVVEEKADDVLIRVQDSGSGVPEHVQKKMFQPFFTTKEVGKGTGLGLSISAGIVKKHKGELYVDSNSSNTCFVIALPKKQSKAAA